MSTTQQTSGSNTSSLQFNPIAQGIYNNLIGTGGNQLNSMIQDPFGNPLYQMGLNQSMKGAQQAGANNMGVLNQNQLTQGLGGQAGAGWLAAQRAMTGRANASILSGANIANVMQALTRQMQATGMGMSFSPQLTGQKGSFSQTQTTGGLGTWLPQLAAAGIGAGMSAATGGMSGAMKAGGPPTSSSGVMGTFPGQSFSGFSGFPSSIMSGAGGPMPSFNPMMSSGGGLGQ